MTGEEFRRRCQSVGLRYGTVSELSGVSRQMLSYYATGQRPIPGDLADKLDIMLSAYEQAYKRTKRAFAEEKASALRKQLEDLQAELKQLDAKGTDEE